MTDQIDNPYEEYENYIAGCYLNIVACQHYLDAFAQGEDPEVLYANQDFQFDTGQREELLENIRQQSLYMHQQMPVFFTPGMSRGMTYIFSVDVFQAMERNIIPYCKKRYARFKENYLFGEEDYSDLQAEYLTGFREEMQSVLHDSKKEFMEQGANATQIGLVHELVLNQGIASTMYELMLEY